MPNLFNIALYQILNLEEDRSGIQNRLFTFLICILKFTEINLQDCVENGTMKHLLNNEVLKMMVDAVDYESSDNKYNIQMKMLLELHLKLGELYTEI